MKFLRLLIVLQAMLWLFACSAPAVKEPAVTKVSWQHQQQILNKIQHWSINGRIAVQTADDGGQADFTWQQHKPTDYDIRLQAPLGAGTTWISGRANGVSLKTSSGDEVFDMDADRLMQRINGWPLPVNGLRFWVRGLPAPGSHYEVTEWSKNGLPAVVHQDGWRIEFRKHKRVSGRLLPKKLFINRLGDEEVDVRLIIRQWVISVEGKDV